MTKGDAGGSAPAPGAAAGGSKGSTVPPGAAGGGGTTPGATTTSANSGNSSSVQATGTGNTASSATAGNQAAVQQGATNAAAATVASQQPKVSPKDGQVIAAILKDLGVTDYEPRVIHQLLEFSYRYVSGILEDAQIFSTYSRKKNIDSEDVRLAVQMQVDKMFTSPPPRELISEIARSKNSIPLPPIKSHAGPRLPPDRYSLIACNYKMKPAPSVNQTVQHGGGTTHITLPFRQGNALLTTRPTGLPVQSANLSGNRITITPVRPGVASTNIISVKRKLEEN